MTVSESDTPERRDARRRRPLAESTRRCRGRSDEMNCRVKRRSSPSIGERAGIAGSTAGNETVRAARSTISAERSSVVPDERERGLRAAGHGRAEAAEHATIDITAQDGLDDASRIDTPRPTQRGSTGPWPERSRGPARGHQCWKPVIPGSKPMPPPGGYSRAELNSFLDWTLIRPGSPCFDATSYACCSAERNSSGFRT